MSSGALRAHGFCFRFLFKTDSVSNGTILVSFSRQHYRPVCKQAVAQEVRDTPPAEEVAETVSDNRGGADIQGQTTQGQPRAHGGVDQDDACVERLIHLVKRVIKQTQY